MTSWAFRFRLRQYLRESLWVVPVVGGVFGVLLAQAALWLGGTVHVSAGWHYSASTASGVLTSIVGAMVALLGFVVTIAFAFALLRRVETNSVPNLGVTVAGLTVGASLALLLIYLNPFTHRLRPVDVAALVERAGEHALAEWDAVVSRSFPDPASRAMARTSDRQGIGAPASPSSSLPFILGG